MQRRGEGALWAVVLNTPGGRETFRSVSPLSCRAPPTRGLPVSFSTGAGKNKKYNLIKFDSPQWFNNQRQHFLSHIGVVYGMI